MKLLQIKHLLEETFFKDQHGGVATDDAPQLLDSLRVLLAAKPLSEETGTAHGALAMLLENELHEFNDPSKTLRAFTDGRESVLTIVEDLGDKRVVIFCAARIGAKVATVNATEITLAPSLGSLARIKEALQQAKRLDDDISFRVSHD